MVFPKAKGFRRLTAPGFYRSCAGALTDGFCPQSGLVQRELCSIAAAGSCILESKRGGRPPLAGRGSALRFRAGRGLCRRVVKAMTAGKNYPVMLTSYSSPKGDTTLSSRRPLRPLERSEHNPSIQPAPSGAPLFILRHQPPPQPSAQRAVAPFYTTCRRRRP